MLAGWRARFGQEIYEAIGMSECSYYISQRRDIPVRPGSVGMPQPGHIVSLVADCAVVGEEVGPDKTLIAAYVLPASGQPADAEAIMAYAAQHMASYKCPRIVHFVADLPRTANGKVLRRALRQGA